MNIVKTKEKGNLIVISGPSGAGKDSIVNNLKKYYKNYWLSVSMTTRPMRPGDIEGVSYYFINKDEFDSRINDNKFLEYAQYNGYYYGTPRDKILDKLNKGIDVILVIEIQGAIKIQKLLPETIFIFILTPSMKELKRRLIERNTEDKDKIIKRFTRAYQEINELTKYNYVVINDDLDEATKKVSAILNSERCRVDRIEEVYLNNMEEEIHELLIDKTIENKDINI